MQSITKTLDIIKIYLFLLFKLSGVFILYKFNTYTSSQVKPNKTKQKRVLE